ncbi:MAG TPA: hypothetical protein VLW53_13560 [Candidatus Eisenbacteria bacterium]|nr:hypothetical protein [Candidatus Eisenbacteria bacterium]
MIDEIVETVVPGGALLTVGVVLGAAIGANLRPAMVRVVAAGLGAAERLQEIGAEAYERAQDLVAEAQHERQAAAPAPATPRRRRGTPETE